MCHLSQICIFQALRHPFFKSDGQFVNASENQEILKHAREHLQTWREMHEADFTKSSLSEFDKILVEIYGQSNNRKQRNQAATNFQGFENSNPLLGDSSPRGKFGATQQQSPSKPGMKGGSDDPFSQFRPQKFHKDQSPRRGQSSNLFATEDVQPRDAQPRDAQPREEFRRAKPKDSLFRPESGTKKGINHQERAERLRQSNPQKYNAVYGSDFMRYGLYALFVLKTDVF